MDLYSPPASEKLIIMDLYSPPASKTYNYGLETVIYKASTNWAKLTSKYKLAISLEEFKIKIKTSKYYICPCRLGKKFQPNLGFVDQGV